MIVDMKTLLLTLSILFFAPQAFAQLADGNYKQPCYLDDQDYLQATWSIKSGEWTRTQVAHQEGTCKSPWLTYQERYQQVFLKFGKLNLLNKDARYMPHSLEVAEVLNSIQFCNFKNWKANTWQNVGGSQCQEFTPPMPQQTTYSIISISDSGFQIGHSSIEADGTSEATRHQEFSPLFFELQ